ncbi:hypothetical protein EG329_007254 [Mollisiaceae sp. DMI_Dod_QoI]|nr:hypothetical protein EG329_007254 [Helotiales sp. DMI_Dod_QoI]
MYLYDDILGIHINTSPLLVSSRALKAARDIDPEYQLEWDVNGFICGIPHGFAMKLTARLGMRMLSVQEYMQLARRHPEVRSEEFSEWLSDTYAVRTGDKTGIQPNAVLVLRQDYSQSPSTLVSENEGIKIPIARPGWFDLDDTGDDGLPTSLCSINQPGQWKFWSPESTEFICGAMRSFVTSSGTCSLDLGIPVFARHPKIMIRECYDQLNISVPSPLSSIWAKYELLTHSRNDIAIAEFINGLDLGQITITDSQDEFLYHKDKERSIDLIGKQRLLKNKQTTQAIIDEGFMLDTLRITPNDETVVVMGHTRPDADSIVSSVFEAVRRRLVYPNQGSIPWCESVPREVRHILGPEATKLLLKIETPRRHYSIVLVDCHQVEPKYQMSVRAIIDHHIINKKFPYYVALSHEVSWSSTVQVYVKILGSGLELSPEMARKLLEATRLEAEPNLLFSMSELDRSAIRRLELIASCAATYYDLMDVMLNTTEAEELFYRDYRQTRYGFSVVKCKESQDFTAIAWSNNLKEHLPLTVIKEVVCAKRFARIRSETILFIVNYKFHDKGFKNAVVEIVAAACRRFHGDSSVTVGGDRITLQGIESQTPRLLLMPLIEDVVKEHIRFTYASCIDRYVSLGFFCGGRTLYGKPGDESRVQTGLSYLDVEALLQNNKHISLLTLPEYWQVYHEMERHGNLLALRSLQHDRYVELLDTIISNTRKIKNGSNAIVEIDFNDVRPALIRAKEGDETTGIPKFLHSPDTYGDKTLWRYWSPDSVENVATRGHIFVMNQTSIDLKVRPQERTQQLTFRPVYRDIPDIRFKIEPDSGRWIKVVIFPRLFSVYNVTSFGGYEESCRAGKQV